jgi:methyl-accepting chemotaxis protein
METMNPEERFERIERQLEFLAVSIQSHDAQIAETWALAKENARQISKNSEQIAAHSQQIAAHSEQIAAHSEQIAAHSEQIAAQSEQIHELSDFVLRIGRIAEEQARRMDAFQARTDECLNTLIHTIERRFPLNN